MTAMQEIKKPKKECTHKQPYYCLITGGLRCKRCMKILPDDFKKTNKYYTTISKKK